MKTLKTLTSEKLPTNINNIKNIILDLDETLINSIIPGELLYSNKGNIFKKKEKLFTHHMMDVDFIVVERPHLQTFLDFIFKNYNVSVWTAASKSYALFIIENILLKSNKKRKLDYILYDSHCNYSKHNTNCIKQLEQLFHLPNYNRRNTLIIDDNDEVSEGNQSIDNKIIHIKKFSFFNNDSENDTELLQIKNFLETKN